MGAAGVAGATADDAIGAPPGCNPPTLPTRSKPIDDDADISLSARLPPPLCMMELLALPAEGLGLPALPTEGLGLWARLWERLWVGDESDAVSDEPVRECRTSRCSCAMNAPSLLVSWMPSNAFMLCEDFALMGSCPRFSATAGLLVLQRAAWWPYVCMGFYARACWESQVPG